MIEPDFCEAQLQALVNGEFCFCCNQFSIVPIPHIPSLPEEAKLGWDTGFYSSNLPPPLQNQKGCNLFIQYKRATLMEKKGGKYSFWNYPYFQYQIPFQRKPSGYALDYHQFDALVNLANLGFVCYYISNQTTDIDELVTRAMNRQIINNSCIIDVGDIKAQHKYVTYTRTSTFCLLHSEPSETKKIKSFDNILLQIKASIRSTINEDYEKLDMLLSDRPIWRKRVDELHSLVSNSKEDYDMPMIKLSVLQRALYDVFGYVWLKLWI